MGVSLFFPDSRCLIIDSHPKADGYRRQDEAECNVLLFLSFVLLALTPFLSFSLLPGAVIRGLEGGLSPC